jgi:hypothetical protein
MTAIAARLVRIWDQPTPYKVVIEHDDMTVTEQACASCREGESLIRQAMAREEAPRSALARTAPPFPWAQRREMDRGERIERVVFPQA